MNAGFGSLGLMTSVLVNINYDHFFLNLWPSWLYHNVVSEWQKPWHYNPCSYHLMEKH